MVARYVVVGGEVWSISPVHTKGLICAICGRSMDIAARVEGFTDDYAIIEDNTQVALCRGYYLLDDTDSIRDIHKRDYLPSEEYVTGRVIQELLRAANSN